MKHTDDIITLEPFIDFDSFECFIGDFVTLYNVTPNLFNTLKIAQHIRINLDLINIDTPTFYNAEITELNKDEKEIEILVY